MDYYNNIINKINEILDEKIIFNNNEYEELKKNIYESIKEYIFINIEEIIYYDFQDNLLNSIKELYSIQLQNYYNIDKIILEYKIEEIIKKCLKEIYKVVIPPRSYIVSYIRNIYIDKTKIREKINIIQNIPQPEQRSDEWYKFRHNLITASSVWKMLKSDSTINQIIYEKCEPYKIPTMNDQSSPLHWGQKYEPISVMLYEYLYDTKIGDFGCIKHPKYNFIGASPDGINIDENNSRYGRMLEIKNIVNRVIDGIPKMEYWIQMQIQMETCDLNECDFLETQFKEYNNYNEFIEDGTFYLNKDNKLKGIIIAFIKDGRIIYEYAPIYLNEDNFNKWEKEILDKNNDKEWLQNIYWYLEKYSNILVLRNKFWFNKIVNKIDKIWKIIEKERIEGYSHRSAKKREKKNDIINNKCLVII